VGVSAIGCNGKFALNSDHSETALANGSSDRLQTFATGEKSRLLRQLLTARPRSEKSLRNRLVHQRQGHAFTHGLLARDPFRNFDAEWIILFISNAANNTRNSGTERAPGFSGSQRCTKYARTHAKFRLWLDSLWRLFKDVLYTLKGMYGMVKYFFASRIWGFFSRSSKLHGY
jgi:hypothetical protein